MPAKVKYPTPKFRVGDLVRQVSTTKDAKGNIIGSNYEGKITTVMNGKTTYYDVVSQTFQEKLLNENELARISAYSNPLVNSANSITVGSNVSFLESANNHLQGIVFGIVSLGYNIRTPNGKTFFRTYNEVTKI